MASKITIDPDNCKEKKTIKVSVIIPVYNSELYIEETLENVIHQTLKDIEIIVVNDGSTDRTLELLEEYQKRDDRITVISQEKADAGTARNRGMKIATGEYLSFLDADDIYQRNLLERSYTAAKEKNAEIVVFRSNRFDEKAESYEDTPWTIRKEFLPEKEVFSHRDMSNIFYCFAGGWAWDKLFLAKFVREAGLEFQEQRWINDKLFVETALAKANRIHVINDVLICKRINNAGSLTTRYASDGKNDYLFRALLAIKKQLTEWGVFQEFEKDFVNYCVHHILWSLDQFFESSTYETIFESTKSRDIKELGLEEAEQKDFHYFEDYRWLKALISSSPEEYRMSRKMLRDSRELKSIFLFPFELVPKGSKIILYAAGKVGRCFYAENICSGWTDIVAWVDREVCKENKLIRSPKVINDFVYDYIVIAMKDRSKAEEIISELNGNGVPGSKLIWRDPSIC